MELDTITLTIANGQSVSDAADLTEREVVGMILPTDLNPSGTPQMEFQASLDGETWLPLNNIESVLTTQASVPGYAARRVAVVPGNQSGISFVSVGQNWKYVQWLKAVAPAAQSAARTLVLIVKERGCSINLEC